MGEGARSFRDRARWRRLVGRLRWTPPADFATFRRQETPLIGINLGAMASLVVLHGLLQPGIKPLTTVATVAFAVRGIMQLAEVAALNRTGFSLGPRATRAYSRASIAMNVLFTAVVALLCGGQESHYAVLFVVPVIAASFRESILGIALVLAVVSALSIGLVWVPFDGHPAAEHVWQSFGAIGISMILLVVAAVVRTLVVDLWKESLRLKETITDLAATRDALVREGKLAAVGRLSAAVAHEVRNPVSMISSAVAMARRPETTEEVRDEVLAIVEREARRMERLTRDFLSYGRDRTPELRTTSLEDTVGMVAGLCRARAEEAGVLLTTSCGVASVRIDPFQVQQALLNITTNGIEATPAGGRVHIDGRVSPGQAIFTVENTGPALPPEAAARFGEPFFTTKTDGSGLGLPITAGIAAALGGALTLARNDPGCVRWEFRVASG